MKRQLRIIHDREWLLNIEKMANDINVGFFALSCRVAKNKKHGNLKVIDSKLHLFIKCF